MVLDLLGLQSYFKSKLEQNSKKSNRSDGKKFTFGFKSFFFALKPRLQVLKFEFCQIKLG